MSAQRTLKLSIQYDGTRFHGWQKQKSLRTVQDSLEKTLVQVLQRNVHIIAAGRTDKGVHAWGQVAHFVTDADLPALTLKKALNRLLPEDVRIRGCQDVEKNFHARFSARAREYVYFLYCDDLCPPFYRKYVLHLSREISLPKLQETLAGFCGAHDFSSFCSVDDPHEKRSCLVYQASVTQCGKLITVSLQANRFLRKMVRMILGFALDVHWRDLDVHVERKRVLMLCSRTAHQYSTAPPHALFLWRVSY